MNIHPGKVERVFREWAYIVFLSGVIPMAVLLHSILARIPHRYKK